MSRCLHFMPAGFHKDRTVRKAALIESIKLRKEWENARAERKKEMKMVENLVKQNTTNDEKKRLKKSVEILEKVKKQNTTNDENKHVKKSVEILEKVKKQNTTKECVKKVKRLKTANDEKPRTTAAGDEAKRLFRAKSNEIYKYRSGKLLTEDEEGSELTEASDPPISHHDCCSSDRNRTGNKRKRQTLDSTDDRVHGVKKIKVRISQPSQRTKKLHNSDRPFNAQCKNEKVPDQIKAEIAGVRKRKSSAPSDSRHNVSGAAIARSAAAEVGARKPTNAARGAVASKRQNRACDSVFNVAREIVARIGYEVPTKKRSLINYRPNVGVLKRLKLHDPTATNVAGGSVARTGTKLQGKRQNRGSKSVSNVARETFAISKVSTKKRSKLNYRPNVSKEAITKLADDLGNKSGLPDPATTNVVEGSLDGIGNELDIKKQNGASESVPSVAKETVASIDSEDPSTSSDRVEVSTESLSRKERMRREAMEYEALFMNWKPPPLELAPEDCEEDLGWLFDTKPKEPCGSETSQPINTAPAPAPAPALAPGLSLWPKAQYIPKARVYALPYTVPF